MRIQKNRSNFSENKEIYKKIEKIIWEKIAIETKISKTEAEVERKLQNLEAKKKMSEKQINEKNKLEENTKVKELQLKLEIKNSELNSLTKEIDIFEKRAILISNGILEKISSDLDLTLNLFVNSFYNAVNSIFIAYELKDKKIIGFDKKVINNAKMFFATLLKR